jgi:hypothetical protein
MFAAFSQPLRMLIVQIPDRSIPELNAIMEEFDALDEEDPISPALTLRLKTAMADMYAFERKSSKEGGTSKPKSTQDAVMVLVKEVREQTKIMTQMLDSYRAVVSVSFPCEVHALTFSSEWAPTTG